MRLAPGSVVAVAVATSLLALAADPDPAHAGRGALIPPMRIDVGPALTGTADRPAVQTVAGLHWASVYPRGTAPFDIGFGLVVVDVVEAAPTAAARMTEVEDPTLRLVGGYAEIATRVAGNHWWRSWVGTRIESGRASLDGADRFVVGAATRVSAEVYLAGAESGSGGLFLGVLAVGVYAEVSARRISDVGDDLGASAGLSVRVPLIVAH